MPKKQFLKCFFGCLNDGPLHKFPSSKSFKWELHQSERLTQWKAVLDPVTIEKGDNYIYNSVRICYRHFEEKYRLPSGLLTLNAVPTLNIEQRNQLPEETATISSIAVTNTTPVPFIQFDVPSTSAAVLGPPSVSCSSSQQKKSSHKSLPYSAKQKTKHSIVVTCNRQLICQKTILRLKEKLENLNQKYKLQQNKIRAAKILSTNKKFLSLIEKLPDNIKIFTKLQMKYKKKPRGRRFTTEEKIMCLTILKQSPKAYKLLKQMFVLPSKRCLQTLLSSFSVQPGLNSAIFNELNEVAKKLPDHQKLVTLLFDEIALEPGLHYNSSRDEIIGFEDNGYTKMTSLADHALVFMIKGIKKKTKQPLCFTFCKGTTKKEDLRILLKNIIKDLHECGFRVIATICDQATTNSSTIKSLQDDTYAEYARGGLEYNSKAFEINGIKVFPLFDPPHLLKGVRNNLLSKDATFVQDGQTKIAKWSHIEMLFDLDEGIDEVRLVNKLTEKHVKKEKIPKMRVKYAAQVFSQRVSGSLRFLARHNVLPKECMDTADFLLIFDKLFDSFNGHSYQADAKKYKCCLSNSSPHFQLWNDLLPILESIKFKSVKNGIIRYDVIPSIKNWINNIKSFMELWVHVNKNHNIFNLITRNFNQDPLEIFFSSVRSNGVRNINPTCNQFINAFKTLIINNFNSPHSARANCEKDDNKSIKSLLNVLHRNVDDSPVADFACEIDNLLELMGQIRNDELLHVESKKYVSGFVIKKCKTKIFRNCKICVKDFCKAQVDLDSFNWEIDYTKKSLFHPSDLFVDLMNNVYFVIAACLRDFSQSTSLKKKIIAFINCICDFSILTCNNHKNELIVMINDLASNIIIHSWCTGVNRILDGKISKFDKNDLIKNAAYDYYCKNKRK